mmetsp:Transcript_11441/g.34975  ORF Transcript_11441/g.34975 Transcript_11441/m.34975 type:complete len:222 (-) Transcript_11441:123-788(-)
MIIPTARLFSQGQRDWRGGIVGLQPESLADRTAEKYEKLLRRRQDGAQEQEEFAQKRQNKNLKAPALGIANALRHGKLAGGIGKSSRLNVQKPGSLNEQTPNPRLKPLSETQRKAITQLLATKVENAQRERADFSDNMSVLINGLDNTNVGSKHKGAGGAHNYISDGYVHDNTSMTMDEQFDADRRSRDMDSNRDTESCGSPSDEQPNGNTAQPVSAESSA